MRALVFGILLLVAFSATALADREPVVFVHGYLGGGWNFDVMKSRLEADGWNASRLFAIDYSNVVGSNVQNARELSAFVDNVLNQTGAAKVDMVVHSMGGLSSRYYIKYLGGDAKVDTLITLGSPHHGTWAALAGVLTEGAQEMLPGSSFLNDLNAGDESWGPVNYVSIRSNVDEVMIPKESPVLSGAENLEVDWVGHLGLLVDDRVYQWVKARLLGDTVAPSSMDVVTGSVAAGSLGSTVADDGAYLQLNQVNTGSVLWPKYDMDVRFHFPVPAGNVTRVDLRADAWNYDDTESFRRYNFATSTWEPVGSIKFGTSDPGAVSYALCDSNCGAYISGGEARVQVWYDSGTPSDMDWVRLDSLGLAVQTAPPPPDPTTPANCVTSTGAISYSNASLYVPSLFTKPVAAAPLFTVGGGVLVTATNSNLNASLWCLNLTAGNINLAPVSGENISGFSMATVDGGVAFALSDPAITVTVQSSNVTYSLAKNGTDLVVSQGNRTVATIPWPGTVSTSDGWNLRAAFLLALPNVSVSPVLSPSSVGLSWGAVAGAATYQVRRATDKVSGWSILANLTTTAFTDGNNTPFSLYTVRPLASDGLPIAEPPMVSKVVRTFTFQPGKTNLQWVSIPFGSKFAKASDIVASIEPGGANSVISMVAKWDPATQATVGYGYVPGVGWMGTDFAISPGDGIYLYLSGNTASFNWTLLDTETPKARTFTFQPGKTNLQWVSIPFASNYSKASGIVAALEPSGGNDKISMVAKWDPATQATVGYGYVPGVGWMGTDFAISPGDGIYLYLSGNTGTFTWTPELVAP